MLETAIVISLIVYFIKVTTWPGMILEKPGDFIERKLGEYWSKPVIGCPICMTPWWGLIIYLLGHAFNIYLFQDVRVATVIYTLFTAAGITSIILMFNKECDVAKKEDKILDEELKK